MSLVKIHCIKGSFDLVESEGVSGLVLVLISAFFWPFFDQALTRVRSLSLF